MVYTLVLLRHGESLWNMENRFTGWTDIDLSEKGVLEAKSAGKILKEKKYRFDLAYTSYLKRAIRTLWLALDEMDMMYLPVECAWQLNERHYGALQGLNKAEMAEKYGEEQVHLWRRSYAIRPPALKLRDSRYPGKDSRYQGIAKSNLPLCESLKDTVKRVLPYWKREIVPKIKSGKRILISAHGNSLRALIKHIDSISDIEIAQLNIPTGIPLVYELNKNLAPIRHFYLADEKKLQGATAAVIKQGQAKK